MSLKLILLSIVLVFICFTTVSAEILDEGSFTNDDAIGVSESISYNSYPGAYSPDELYFMQIELHAGGISYIYQDVSDANFLGSLKSEHDSYFEDCYIEEVSTHVADGKIGYYKLTNGSYRVWMWFDLSSWDIGSFTGETRCEIVGHNKVYYKTQYYKRVGQTASSNYAVWYANTSSVSNFVGTYKIYTTYSFKNTYFTEIISPFFYVNVTKDYSGSTASKITVTNNSGYVLYQEGSYLENDLKILNEDDNIPYTIYCEDEIGYNQSALLIFQSTYDPTKLRLECGDIDIGTTIEVSYYNIDDLRANFYEYGHNCFEEQDLYIQIVCDRGYYDELIYSDLIMNESDNTLYYVSGTLDPGTYYAQINCLYSGLNEYAVRDVFIISEPANFSIKVVPDELYIGDTANIIYKALNSSTISVFDAANTKIDYWVNVQGQSQIIYQIPIDSTYAYSYSDWYVYLNDSGNSSNNLRYNFTVEWKVYVPPIPTPTPIPEDYNATIEETVGTLKESINPILDLVYGLSTIFVDNPDYDHDQIVTSAELKVWFNSLIPFVILIIILLVYKVLKRK